MHRLLHTHDHMLRDRSTGRQYAFQGQQSDLLRLAVLPHDIPQRRRAKGLSDSPVFHSLHDLAGIDLRRPRGIHVRNDSRNPHRAVIEGKQRKSRQIDFARLDSIKLAQLGHLAIEVAVAIQHPLGRPGAAGGQGAPLAPAFHQGVFAGPDEIRCILNVGGISNISILHNDTVFGYDTGPGNCLMDGWVNAHYGLDYDKDAEILETDIPPITRYIIEKKIKPLKLTRNMSRRSIL